LTRDTLGMIRNSSFDRNALNRRADQTGSGRVAVEKDFVISVILMLIAGLPEFSLFSDGIDPVQHQTEGSPPPADRELARFHEP
jgi:hypothetical protein